MNLQTISLKPETSMIEVMRRFHREPGATVIKAKHTRGDDSTAGFWSILFVGTMPDLSDLMQVEVEQ